MEWFWLFLSYGFLGYLLERMFAKVTAAVPGLRHRYGGIPGREGLDRRQRLAGEDGGVKAPGGH